MSPPPQRPAAVPLSQAVDEFGLTAVLLFLVVTMVRWLRAPDSPAYVGNLHAALAILGPATGILVTLLIVSPPGRRSGGHMNPAVTVAVWLMDVFPGASVLPYIVAQLAGSVVGVAVGRLVWGPVVSSPQIHDTAVMPAPGWTSSAVFVAEVACLIVLTLAVGFLLAYPQFSPLLPATVGTVIAVTIIILGPLSGGSANPIRQFGPALLSGRLTDFWIYMVGPILGAALGASVHHLLYQRLQVRAPLTYRLTGAKQAPAHPGLPSAAADGRG